MRVTKTIREFIEKEVSTRLEPKYEADKVEAEKQKKAFDDFLEGCAEAAEEAFKVYFDNHFHDIADFTEDIRGDCSPISFYTSRVARIQDMYINSVHRWRDRKRAEAKEIVDNIIVNLELGGSKAELMEMLDKVGRV